MISSAPITGARLMWRWRIRCSPRPSACRPLVHHEDGFNEDEAGGLKPRRNLYRRAALRAASRVIVPSTGLEKIALGPWALPPQKVLRIANGIDTAAFAATPNPRALRVFKRKGERMESARSPACATVKQLPLLVEAMAGLPEEWHLRDSGRKGRSAM